MPLHLGTHWTAIGEVSSCNISHTHISLHLSLNLSLDSLTATITIAKAPACCNGSLSEPTKLFCSPSLSSTIQCTLQHYYWCGYGCALDTYHPNSIFPSITNHTHHFSPPTTSNNIQPFQSTPQKTNHLHHLPLIQSVPQLILNTPHPRPHTASSTTHHHCSLLCLPVVDKNTPSLFPRSLYYVWWPACKTFSLTPTSPKAHGPPTTQNIARFSVAW